MSQFKDRAPTFQEILDRGYLVAGEPDEVAARLRQIATDLNVGQLMLLLQFGNMDKQLTRYNTRLFAERVMPQIADLFEDQWEDHWWPAGLRKPRDGRGRMSVALDAALRTYTVAVNGQPCRVWEKGEGAPLVFLAGFGGLPRWTECLDAPRRAPSRDRTLSARISRHRRDRPALHPARLAARHSRSHRGAGLERCDLMGVSLGAALAADVAALWPDLVDRLVLVSRPRPVR